ncbi:MAG: EAL domain-containing protein, partial [Oceanobacter sp.]
QQMDRLRARGVEFSIDDFGTGYSSLSKIKSMPVSLLKIDKSFIQDILIDKNDYEIARAVILMAKSLGLTVVAEGVETTEQETILADMGCDWVQGYLYGPPLTSKDFVSFFHTSTADDDQQNVLPAS